MASVDSFDGDRNNFEAWIALVENAVQLTGQHILQIAFSKMVGSPVTSAYRLRNGSPNLT